MSRIDIILIPIIVTTLYIIKFLTIGEFVISIMTCIVVMIAFRYTQSYRELLAVGFVSAIIVGFIYVFI